MINFIQKKLDSVYLKIKFFLVVLVLFKNEFKQGGITGLYLAVKRNRRKKSVHKLLFDDLKKRFRDKEKYKNSIVFFRPHGVGDLLMGLPAFEKYRKMHPEKRIILYVYEESYSLMSLFDFFDEVISLPRSFNYKYAIDTIPRPKWADFINLMVEVSEKEGYNNFNTLENKTHRNDTFSQVLGVQNSFNEVDIPIDKIAKDKLQQLISQELFSSGMIVTVTFESMSHLRIWYPAYYRDFLEYVMSFGYIVVVVGNKEKNEEYFPQESKNFINLIGKMSSLNEVLELVRISKYVISVDTYLCHLSGILGIPFLGIFTGGVDPSSRISYYKKKEIASLNLPCACWDMGCDNSNISIGSEPCKVSLTPTVIKKIFLKLIETYGR